MCLPAALDAIKGNPITQFDHLTSLKTIYWLSTGWTEISFGEIYRGLPWLYPPCFIRRSRSRPAVWCRDLGELRGD